MTNDATNPPQPAEIPRKKSTSKRKAWILLFWLLVCSGVLTWSVVAVRQAREEAMATNCQYHLHMLYFGVTGFQSCNGSLPPAFLVDENEKPMHSWRALVMPYFSYSVWRSSYSLAEPWDGQNNQKCRGYDYIFQCPSAECSKPGIVDYVAVTGPDTLWPGKDRVKTRGNQDTILLIELPGSDFEGLDPRCLTVDEFIEKIKSPTGRGIRTIHPKGLAYVTLGGEVRWLPPDTDPESLRKMFARDPACEVVPATEKMRDVERWNEPEYQRK